MFHIIFRVVLRLEWDHLYPYYKNLFLPHFLFSLLAPPAAQPKNVSFPSLPSLILWILSSYLPHNPNLFPVSGFPNTKILPFPSLQASSDGSCPARRRCPLLTRPLRIVKMILSSLISHQSHHLLPFSCILYVLQTPGVNYF